MGCHYRQNSVIVTFVNGASNFVYGAFVFINGAFVFVNGAFNFVNGAPIFFIIIFLMLPPYCVNMVILLITALSVRKRLNLNLLSRAEI